MSPGPSTVPTGRSRAAVRLRRAGARFGTSHGAGAFTPSPSAAVAVRMPSTIARSSPGSSDAAWSGPGSERSSVKCFSTSTAPSAAAAIGTAMPRVWSDNPVLVPKRSRMVAIARRFAASGGAGYSVVHCSTVTRSRTASAPSAVPSASRATARDSGTPSRVNPNATTPSASAISSSSAMPVETISGSPVRAACSRNGPLVISPDGTFTRRIPMRPTRNSRLSTSNAVLRNSMPRSRHRAASASWSESLSSSRRSMPSWPSSPPVVTTW